MIFSVGLDTKLSFEYFLSSIPVSASKKLRIMSKSLCFLHDLVLVLMLFEHPASSTLGF